MIKRNTWILLFLLVLIVAGYLLWKGSPSRQEAAETPTPTAEETGFLLTEADGLLTGMRIEQEDRVVMLERDSFGLWTIVLPAPGETDLALASAAETQLMSMAIVTVLESSLEMDIIGLASPAYVITATFDSGARHVIEVGDTTPTGSGYYVRLDSDEIYIVSLSAIDPLAQMLSAPPYVPTATPGPPTDTPTPEATATP